ncbi:MAG: 7-cyano-7-deazaguanine synthase [Xanthobacteraceae bacterium]
MRFAAISETALTRDAAITIAANGLPNTFVPGRNLPCCRFCGCARLSPRRQASRRRHVRGRSLGYPDCRDDTLKAMQLALNLGMERRFVVHTPLMWIDKAATFALAHELGGQSFIDMLLEHTHTCYLGDRSHRHAWGYGCGECPACRLRADGHARWIASR